MKSVGIVGGGLAGLAAAAALCERGVSVELFEARRQLGGRAGSFRDPSTEELIDHCQHVAMGCCTNLADFCRRTGIDELFHRYEVIHFFGPNGRRYDLGASPWLPAPLHLAPSLMRLGYLSPAERLSVSRCLLRLARTSCSDAPNSPTIGQWLRQQGQSARAVQRFWSVVLVSALGESVEYASVAAARKVFVDGFMAHRQAFYVEVPAVPLDELYGRVRQWLIEQGAQLHLSRAVRQIGGSANEVSSVRLADSSVRLFDYIIVAVPWHQACSLLAESVMSAVGNLDMVKQITSSPISAIHLWFDRPITPLPHAVLVDRLSQWVFNRGQRPPGRNGTAAHYYQVVISASRELARRDRGEVLRQVVDDLQAVWPAARDATLVHWRIVTQVDAVFSVRPGLEQLRPRQATAIPNLMLAGDWTQTGWPATMEGAVRSGYLAAEAVLRSLGNSDRVVVNELPRSWLTRLLIRRR